jgi:hypothetical protein
VTRRSIRSAGEGWVGECADRNYNLVWLCRVCLEDRRAAVRAEMKDMLLSVLLVRDSHVLAEATNDLHLIGCERRLDPEGTSCPTLAGKAVTHETQIGSPAASSGRFSGGASPPSHVTCFESDGATP